MDPELRKELDALHALVRDNHRILRHVRRHQIYETFGHYALWIFIILASGYSYLVYVQPLIQKFQVNPQGAAQSLFGLPTTADLQNLINSYKPAGK